MFLSLLNKKGLLLRNYTQNIDMLEARAGYAQNFILYVILLTWCLEYPKTNLLKPMDHFPGQHA